MNQFAAWRWLRVGLLAACLLNAGAVLGQDENDPTDEQALDESADAADVDAEVDAGAATADATDPADDADPADAAEDAAAAPGVDEDAQAGEADDAGDAEGDGDDGAELPAVAWTPVPMAEDEVWAPDVSDDPADDSIPIDTELDPSGADWQVAADDIVSDYSEDVAAVEQGGIRTPGDMPIVRRGKSSAPSQPATSQRAAAAGTPRAARPGDDDDVTYSTGGKPIRDDGAPWQAQIYYPNSAPQWAEKLRQGVPLWQLQHYCGGSLIADDWVLTAAHCIDDDMVRAGYRVRLGMSDISKPGDGWSYRIDRIVRHSQYADESLPKSPNRYANDIALVHIVADRQLPPRDPKRVRPIPLLAEPLQPGVQVAATGWGKTEAVDGAAPSAVLMRVDLRVMDTERCKQLPGYGPQKISPRVICAANPQKSTCQGDSGGGLTLASGTPRVVGIVSWGKRRCSGDGQPGAYTRIESFRGWIQQAMALNPQKSSLP